MLEFWLKLNRIFITRRAKRKKYSDKNGEREDEREAAMSAARPVLKQLPVGTYHSLSGVQGQFLLFDLWEAT